MNRPKAVLPDAVSSDEIILIKCCDYLRLTYEIKLLQYFAHSEKKRLVLMVPDHLTMSKDLMNYITKNTIAVRGEK